ncbi:MAG: glycosyltransferase, partial [Planctomycetaceae bacterium]|nr:glycosyltransferase [Planctomycetaceae bacterium]
MLTVINTILIVGTLLLLVPFLVFCLECATALLPWRPRTIIDDSKPASVAVLLPAHNESTVIARTLDVLLPTLGEQDRAVVIADNCSDDTAEIARSKGAIAYERTNLEQRGKGYALDFGVQQLKENPPDVVMVLDADCNVDPLTVRTIGQLAHTTGRPVQSLNLGELDEQPDSMFVASSLGNYFINYIRPLGLKKIGLSYRLLGTGMALPWSIIKDAPLATGHIVEDTRLGVDLAIDGHLPIFCPDVRVLSRLPQQKSSFVSQRTRWEHGHMQAAFSQVPRLVGAGLMNRSLPLFWLGMDIAVPPFSLMIFLWLLATLVTGIAGLCGATFLPFWALCITGFCLSTLIGLNWFVHCRHVIPMSALA